MFCNSQMDKLVWSSHCIMRPPPFIPDEVSSESTGVAGCSHPDFLLPVPGLWRTHCFCKLQPAQVCSLFGVWCEPANLRQTQQIGITLLDKGNLLRIPSGNFILDRSFKDFLNNYYCIAEGQCRMSSEGYHVGHWWQSQESTRVLGSPKAGQGCKWYTTKAIEDASRTLASIWKE